MSFSIPIVDDQPDSNPGEFDEFTLRPPRIYRDAGTPVAAANASA
jgi:hypothetical protein